METAIVMNFRDVTGHWGGLLWITPQKKWFLGRGCLSVSEEILGYASCLLWAFQAVCDESLYLCITTWFGPRRMPLLVIMENTLCYTILGSFSRSTSGKKFVPAEGCQTHGLWILRSYFLAEEVRWSKRARLLFWTSSVARLGWSDRLGEEWRYNKKGAGEVRICYYRAWSPQGRDGRQMHK